MGNLRGARKALATITTRVRPGGLRLILYSERDWALRTIKTAVAGALAWLVAESFLHTSTPALAPLAAVITVQVTIYETVARSIQYSVGVVAGFLVALLLGSLLGPHAWAVGVMIVLALLAGRILRLGPQSSQVAITALFVFSIGSGYGVARIIDTLVGAGIGIAINAVVAPPVHLKSAAEAITDLAADIAHLLQDMGRDLSHEWTLSDAREWLERARNLTQPVHDARAAVRRAEESLRLNPRKWEPPAAVTRSPRSRQLVQKWRAPPHLFRRREALFALEHAAIQIRGIARSLTDAAERNEEELDRQGPALPEAVGRLLAEAGEAFLSYARIQGAEDSVDPSDRKNLVDAIEVSRKLTHDLLHSRWAASSEAEAWPVRGALLEDVRRLLDEIDLEKGPHKKAVP